MSDLLDDADAATELWLQENLRRRPKVPASTGRCLVCEEPAPGAFCSKECGEDFEKITRQRAISGKG
jgi:predicted nucleic acid-binding Zn ribbon protein